MCTFKKRAGSILVGKLPCGSRILDNVILTDVAAFGQEFAGAG
jgi:hypothetical protein